MSRKGKSDIAIVGVAFRLPGEVTTFERLWEVLSNRENLITEIDESRFYKRHFLHSRKHEPGKSYTFKAGVLSQINHFDAEFFGISPREAQQMDPQQRLLLETTWSALENGQQDPEKLSGSDCAVYVGISGNEHVYHTVNDTTHIDSYTMLGNCPSIAANRISYLLNLHGPSMSIDTACSSGLVALHQACQCLRNQESSMAIVGGVNLLLSPHSFIGFSKASMLSPVGQCKSFSDDGMGYVRSEGCVVLLLKTIEEAERAGDRIYATILQSGVNSDGRTPGIALPSSDAQAALLSRIHKNAQIKPDDLSYIETHGTGTVVGDFAETQALGNAIAQKRSKNNPLLIGSIKSNLGHLEPVSGLVGILKIILCMQKYEIPPSIQADTLNSRIDFSSLNLKVVRDSVILSAKSNNTNKNQLVMAVNSFGFGGTNAHVILASPKPDSLPDSLPGTVIEPPKYLNINNFILVINYHHKRALKLLAEAYLAWIQAHANTENNITNFYYLSYILASRKPRWPHRILIHGDSIKSVCRELEQISQGESSAHSVSVESIMANQGVVFVYSGNGAQWQGMAQCLLNKPSVFSETIDEIDLLFKQFSHISIKQELLASVENSRYEETEVAQPCLFAIQVAVTRYLLQKGLKIRATLGHSVGEIAAAWACGALDLHQAVEVVYHRSYWQGKTKGCGRMMAVAMSEESANHLISNNLLGENLGKSALDSVCVAAINSPQGVTLAGNLQDLLYLQTILEKQSIFCQFLDLDYAFHTHYMDSIQDNLLAALKHIQPKKSTIPFISTVTGKKISGDKLNALYWWKNIREPVQFASAIQTLIDSKHCLMMEIGPHCVLKFYIEEMARLSKVKLGIIPTMRRHKAHEFELDHAFYTAWLHGAEWDQTKLYSGLDCASYFRENNDLYEKLNLPSYPWIKQQYQLIPTDDSTYLADKAMEHCLLGHRVVSHYPIWECHMDETCVSYLADHQVGGVVIMPAAGYVEMALAAAVQAYGHGQQDIRDLDILAPMIFDGKNLKVVRFELHAQGYFKIKSRQKNSEEGWSLHAVGRAIEKPNILADLLPDLNLENSGYLNEFIQNAEYSCGGDFFYIQANNVGLTYGPQFQGIQAVWLKDNMAVADVQFPSHLTQDHYLYPGILDSCFQLLIGLIHFVYKFSDVVFLPVRVGRLKIFSIAPSAGIITAKVIKNSKQSCLVDFAIFDKNHTLLAQIQGCRFQQAYLQDRSHLIKHYSCVPYLLRNFSDVQTHNQNNYVALKTQQQAKLGQLVKFDNLENKNFNNKLYFESILPLFDLIIVQFIYEAMKINLVQYGNLNNLNSLLGERENFIEWCFQCVAEDGLAQKKSDGTWDLLPQTEAFSAQALWNMLLAEYPDYYIELLMIGKMGLLLADFEKFSSEKINQEIVKTHQTIKARYQHYFLEESPALKDIQRLFSQYISQYVAEKPSTQRLRILDLGYGIGPMTMTILDALPLNRVDYDLFVINDKNQWELESFGEINLLVINDSALNLTELLNQNKFMQAYDLILVRNPSAFAETFFDFTLLNNVLSTEGCLLVLEQYSNRFNSFVLSSESYASDDWAKALNSAGFAINKIIHEPHAQANEGYYFVSAMQNVDLTVNKPESFEKNSQLINNSELYCVVYDEKAAEFAESFINVISVISDHRAKADVKSEHKYQLVLSHRSVDLRIEAVYNASVKQQKCIHFVWFVDQAQTVEHSLAQINRLIEWVKEIHHYPWLTWPKLTVVTQNALSNPELEPELYSVNDADVPYNLNSMLWGFVRVLVNEHPELRAQLIDLSSVVNNGLDEKLPIINILTQKLYQEMTHDSQENEIILTEKARYGLRVMTRNLLRNIHNANTEVSNKDFRLDFKKAGLLSNLCWSPVTERMLGDNEVLVRPYACGLNFRDVMYAMGLLPDEAVEQGFLGASLGMEFAGEILHVGAKVKRYKTGDAVMGFAPSSFSSKTITQEQVITHLPSGWTYPMAATIPIAFFTAYYAMSYLARLQAGERILIHGAAGGVGLAAIQVAKYLGAEIYTTAGSHDKRDFLNLMGIPYCYDSRSLLYADQILHDTKGEGVDVILNCLAGEAINANLSILKPFGRFLELGKRDFFANSQVGLRPFRNNISFFGIDADQLLIQNPQLCAQLFQEVMDLFAQKIFSPLPFQLFTTRTISEPFKYMQQSQHIGKIVVDLSVPPNLTSQDSSDNLVHSNHLSICGDAYYLITGGCSGFGLQTAEWLIKRGVKKLILINRRGLQTPIHQTNMNSDYISQDYIVKQAQLGIEITVVALDMGDSKQVEDFFHLLHKQNKVIKGIIHAAAVYEDSMILNLNPEKLKNVMHPKVQGLLNLHHASQLTNCELDFFVVYSSVTTLFGNPGQANYVAANACMEQLIHYRRSLGLPGLYIAWGPIADTGYLVENDKLKQVISSKMGQLLLAKEALSYLENQILSNNAGVAVACVQFAKLKNHMPAIEYNKFSMILHYENKYDIKIEQPEDMRSMILERTDLEAVELINPILIHEIAHILRLQPEKIKPDISLLDLGMDSLVGAELSHVISERFAMHIPMLSLAQGLSVNAISERIIKQVRQDNASHAENKNTDEMHQINLVLQEAEKHGETITAEMAAEMAKNFVEIES